MTAELRNKGIDSELIQEVLEREDCVDESSAIRRWMDKKHFDPQTAGREQQRKFYQFLLRKGFLYEDIHRAVGLCMWTE